MALLDMLKSLVLILKAISSDEMDETGAHYTE